MASRFMQRDSRPSLFSAYESSRDREKSDPPNSNQRRLPYHTKIDSSHGTQSGTLAEADNTAGFAGSQGQFRIATPNRRGQYSDAVLSELESQNEDQLEGMSAKVRMLKDITLAIGDEIRDSTAIAEKMNDSFENTRIRLHGTMNRMLRMAERTGVGWKVWIVFFATITLLFWYVWAWR